MSEGKVPGDGQTATTHNVQLDQGVELTGTFRTPDGTPFLSGFVVARSVDIGDNAGVGSVTDGRFTVPASGSMSVDLVVPTI
ncbi:hypothetical protein ACLQ28_04085 [Micromonospora sp. DT201]|uniref:hypothetical protein n=1 Tax=Micromonospora sp. DT201 TaxID=3393442 RepID=UPI003CFB8F5A